MRPTRGPNWERNRARRAQQLERAAVRFAELIGLLGAECDECGETAPELLSIDHVDGITWDRRAMRWDARVGRYLREYAEGVRLRVLCLPCNSRDGSARQLAELETECPF